MQPQPTTPVVTAPPLVLLTAVAVQDNYPAYTQLTESAGIFDESFSDTFE